MNEDEVNGCRCNKTKCKKKYCVCYRANKQCSIKCTCTKCDNGNSKLKNN